MKCRYQVFAAEQRGASVGRTCGSEVREGKSGMVEQEGKNMAFTLSQIGDVKSRGLKISSDGLFDRGEGVK